MDVSVLINSKETGGYSLLHQTYCIALDGSYLYMQSSLRGVVILKITFIVAPRLPVGILVTAIAVPIIGVVIITAIIVVRKRKK